MNWLIWILIGGGIIAYLAFKRLTFIAPARARELLRGGALVIDVRTAGEFKGKCLPGAINLPLDQLGQRVLKTAPNKDQALLIHCLSGGRSAIGAAILKKMGYRNAFNLGSYTRAKRILETNAES